MISLICFLVLLFHQTNIGRVDATLNCAEGYVDYGSTKLCLYVPMHKSQYETVCDQNDGKVFISRMTDEMFKQLGKDMKYIADALPFNAFVGMKKGDFMSKEWQFTNKKGSIKPEDYPFWARDPGQDDCGMMETGQSDVIPLQCSQTQLAICGKEKAPCADQQMYYAEYYGHCLSLSAQKESFDRVHFFCNKGYILPVTDEETRDLAAAVLYTAPSPVYAALEKKDGKWLYESGEEETAMDRFAGGKPGNENCGVYGLNHHGETVIYTANCDTIVRPLCEEIRS